LNHDTSKFAASHVWNFDELRRHDSQCAACCRSKVDGDARNGTLLLSASQRPAAIHHPQLSIRGRTFVALLGPGIEKGIAGFGDTVQAALRAFDLQYSRCLTAAADHD
jgi:hypothetical protein